ncbi:MAG: hypothetical protein WDN72_00910 [Alphaproteobacteria bacterium]
MNQGRARLAALARDVVGGAGRRRGRLRRARLVRLPVRHPLDERRQHHGRQRRARRGEGSPANPGGEDFPNKDKTIYNAIAPDNGGQKVEKLLPDSEKPAPASEEQAKGAVNNTTTYVNIP